MSPNVQIEGPEDIVVAGEASLEVDPGSSDSEDEMAEYMWSRSLSVADRVKLKRTSLPWVGRAVSGLRHDRLKSRVIIKELRDKVRASQDETNVLQEKAARRQDHVSELEKKLVELKAQLMESIEQLGAASKRSVQLPLEMKEFVRRLEGNKGVAEEKLRKVKMEHHEALTSNEAQVDQAMRDLKVSTVKAQESRLRHMNEIDELQSQLFMLRQEKEQAFQSGVVFASSAESEAAVSNQDQSGEPQQFNLLVSTLNQFMTKVNVSMEGSGSRGRSEATVKYFMNINI